MHIVPIRCEKKKLLSCLTYGFPMGNVGHVDQVTDTMSNHASATQFVDKVNKFMDKEVSTGAMHCPFMRPPFEQWKHISPIMSRPKSKA